MKFPQLARFAIAAKCLQIRYAGGSVRSADNAC